MGPAYTLGTNDGASLTTAKREPVAPELLARHYRQLRGSHGTVLLGEPPPPDTLPLLDPSWFIPECPLDPNGAVDAIRLRHGFASRSTALRALRKARDTLSAAGDTAAVGLEDLP